MRARSQADTDLPMAPAFRYLRDPVFRVAVGLYFANRWILKSAVPCDLTIGYANDLLAIPVVVPPMLWLGRRLGLRRSDGPPEWAEVLLPVLAWAWVFEIWMPAIDAFDRVSTADSVDVLCYALGAFVSAGIWRWRHHSGGVANSDLPVGPLPR